MTSDLKLLIMEAAPLGNLRQYLEIKANEMYYNVTSSKTLEMDFINQIIEASDAVHQLDPPSLFYCLCASNVLLSSDQKCKLSGFASKESVRAREKWEEEYNVETFTYLGIIIDKHGSKDPDVKSRIGKTRGVFIQLKNIWYSKMLSKHTKIRLFNSNV
ncbi:hypothetical protein LSH36_2974g00008, partial [Paralvinella palmiformis]